MVEEGGKRIDKLEPHISNAPPYLSPLSPHLLHYLTLIQHSDPHLSMLRSLHLSSLHSHLLPFSSLAGAPAGLTSMDCVGPPGFLAFCLPGGLSQRKVPAGVWQMRRERLGFIFPPAHFLPACLGPKFLAGVLSPMTSAIDAPTLRQVTPGIHGLVFGACSLGPKF